MSDENVFDLNAKKPVETDEELIARLSALSIVEYEQCRKKESDKLGVRTPILDKLIQSQRNSNETDSIVEEISPFSSEVNADQLLNTIEEKILKHCVLPKGASTAITLWIVGSYAINSFRIFPKMLLHSPEKRCGKSTVLDLIETFSNRSLLASSISPAAIYRVIDAHQPTLIIDEADTFIAGRNDEMVGIINSGHARNRAFVIRCEGDDNKAKKFSSWTPMALASIKQLQSTIMDRSIVIQLRRRTQAEKVSRITGDIKAKNLLIRKQLMKWCIDNQADLMNKQIEPPNLGNDRAIDNWLPLFTIAKLVGGDWFSKCETSYQMLNDYEDEPLPSTQLLEDIRKIFSDWPHDKIPSKELVYQLVQLEDHPWCEWKRGQPMTQTSLSKLLKTYGISSKSVRMVSGETPKGFNIKQFKDAFDRYLQPLDLTVLVNDIDKNPF